MPASHVLRRTSLLACSFIATPAAAQEPQRAHQFIDRFNAANTTHDGRLTREQAQAANMPYLVRHFDQIDTQHKGYVTLGDIRAYRQQMHAATSGQSGPLN